MAHARKISRSAGREQPDSGPQFKRTRHPHRVFARGLGGPGGRRDLLHPACGDSGRDHCLGVCAIWAFAGSCGRAVRRQAGCHRGNSTGVVGTGSHGRQELGACGCGRDLRGSQFLGNESQWRYFLGPARSSPVSMQFPKGARERKPRSAVRSFCFGANFVQILRDFFRWREPRGRRRLCPDFGPCSWCS